MTFLCPACHEVKPLAEGQLVSEHQPRQNHGHGYTRNAAQPVVVILCAPCTADLILVRAGIR